MKEFVFFFLIFQPKLYVVGTQNCCLKETLFEHPKHKKIIKILHAKCLIIWMYVKLLVLSCTGSSKEM